MISTSCYVIIEPMKQVMFLLVAMFTIAFSGVSKANTYPTQTENSYSIDQNTSSFEGVVEVFVASEEVGCFTFAVYKTSFVNFEGVLAIATAEFIPYSTLESRNGFELFLKEKESESKRGVLITQLKFLNYKDLTCSSDARILGLDGLLNSFNRFNTYSA